MELTMVAMSVTVSSLADAVEMFTYGVGRDPLETSDVALLIGGVSVPESTIFAHTDADLMVAWEIESLLHRVISPVAGLAFACNEKTTQLNQRELVRLGNIEEHFIACVFRKAIS